MIAVNTHVQTADEFLAAFLLQFAASEGKMRPAKVLQTDLQWSLGGKIGVCGHEYGSGNGDEKVEN